jgi:hypothetical protein
MSTDQLARMALCLIHDGAGLDDEPGTIADAFFCLRRHGYSALIAGGYIDAVRGAAREYMRQRAVARAA